MSVKVGDRVRCIDIVHVPYGCLRNGEVYTVTKVTVEKDTFGDLCQEFLTEGFLRENFTTNPFTVLHELQKALLDEK